MNTKRQMTTQRRTLIFGIDGGTWSILDRMIARGIMPTLGELKEQGAWGTSLSVIPVNSAAAWSTLLCGQNPGQHSVYDFFTWHPETQCRTTVNSTWLPRPTVLDLMGQNGALLALKIPMTYPPWKINGYMVSGLPTPDDESAFTYPVSLAKRLNPMIEKGSAGRNWQMRDESRREILEQLERSQRGLERLTQALIDDERISTCYTVVRDVDELQHFFWDVLTGIDTFGYLPRIDAYFKRIDSYLARLLNWAGRNARVAIISDHGFGSLEAVWHINDWLAQKGFLKLKATEETPTDESLSLGLRLNFALQRRMLRRLQRWGLKGDWLERSLNEIKLSSQRHTDLGAIAWDQTSVYAGNVGEEFLPLYVNLAGREPFGSVPRDNYEPVRRRVKEELEACQAPAVMTVHFGEELFGNTDPQTRSAPDLVVETLTSAVQSDFAVNQSEIYERSRYRKACHRREGILLLHGPDVAPQQIKADLADVPATLLAWMGIAVPSNYTGRVIGECIDGLKPTTASTADSKVIREFFSETEEEGVRKKLESLGYM